MNEPPARLSEDDIVAAIREGWGLPVDQLEHLPIGFGAYHWAVECDGVRTHFASYDVFDGRHDRRSLEGAYAGAAALPLPWALKPVPTDSGAFLCCLGDGALSLTPWRDGKSGDGPMGSELEAHDTAQMLAQLHGLRPPIGLPVWSPLVPADYADLLAARLRSPWDSGPFADRARTALTKHLPDVERWVAGYHAHAAHAGYQPWVATHGEPHTRNQLVTSKGTLMVDWESLKLAPKERDFRVLLECPFNWRASYRIAEPDQRMVEMFDLEWRLDEINEYADWLSAEHTGTESDEGAFAGLIEQLERE